ncbi:MAG: hypothetical protein ABW092_13545 [Candidatus Thiodiazotropha sp.]
MKVEKFSETDSISIKTPTYDIKWEINNTKSKTLRAAAKWTAISRGGGHYANLTKLQIHANNKATDNTININYEPKQKYRLGTVSNLITGGLNRFLTCHPRPLLLQWCIRPQTHLPHYIRKTFNNYFLPIFYIYKPTGIWE